MGRNRSFPRREFACGVALCFRSNHFSRALYRYLRQVSALYSRLTGAASIHLCVRYFIPCPERQLVGLVAHVLQVVLHMGERARVFCFSLVTLLTKLPNQSYIDPSCLSCHVMHSSRRQELHDCCMTIASNSQTSSCCCAREHQSSGGDAR